MRIIWFWHFQRTGFRFRGWALGVCQCSSESGSFVFCPCIRSLQYGVQYWFPAENCQLWSSLCLVREEKKRVEKEKNNPKGFCPISLNNTHVAYKGPNWKKPNWSNNRQKFHRSKNSLIQLFFQDTLLSKVSLFPVISQHLQHIYSTCRPAIKLSIFYLQNYFFSFRYDWMEMKLCST